MKNAKIQNRFKLCMTVLLVIAVVLCTLPILNLQKAGAADGDENWYIPRVEDTMVNFAQIKWPQLTPTDLQDGGVKWQWTNALVAMMDGISKTFPLDGLTMKFNNLTKGAGNGGSLAFSIASIGGWTLQNYNTSLALILNTAEGKLNAQFNGANEITLITNTALEYSSITDKPFEISIHKETGGYKVTVKIESTEVSGSIPDASLAGVFGGNLFDRENVLVALSPIEANSTTSVELLAMGPRFNWPANASRIIPQKSNMYLDYAGWTAFTQKDLVNGLRLNWLNGVQNMRITTKDPLNLDRLVIEMNDYKKDIDIGGNAGIPAFVFGNKASPEVGTGAGAGMTITFDATDGGRLISKSGTQTYVIATNARLHPNRLIGRPIKLSFEAVGDGSYNVTTKVGSVEITGSLPKAAIDGADDLTNTGAVKVSATIVDSTSISVSYVLNGIQNESTTWDVDTLMNKQNAWHSSSINTEIVNAMVSWASSGNLILADIPGGGLRYSFNASNSAYREGYKNNIDLSGTLLQFNNLSAAAKLQMFFANGNSNLNGWAPEKDQNPNMLAVRLDTTAGKLTVLPEAGGTELALTNNALQTANITGKPFSIAFKKQSNGTYTITVNVDGTDLPVLTIPTAVLTGITAPADLTSCKVILSMFGGVQSTFSVDFIGVKDIKEDTSAVDAVIAAINAIGTVSLANGSPIRHARRLYNALSTEKKLQITNYTTLEAAETEYAQLTLLADVELNAMSKANGIISNNGSGLIEPSGGWSSNIKITDIATGGLRYEFTSGNQNIREGYKAMMSLDRLLLQFDNLYSAQSTGKIGLIMGSGGSYGPEYSGTQKSLVLVLDTATGTITAYNDGSSTTTNGTVLITDNALKHENLTGKRFAYYFEKQSNDDYELQVHVDGQILNGVISASVISAATNFNPASLYTMVSGWLTTCQVDYLGFKNIEKTTDVSEVIAAINAINTVELKDGSPIRHARRLYNTVAEGDKALVTNYSILQAAETEYARLTAEADGWLTPMNKSNALLSGNTSEAVQNTLNNDWKNFLKLTDIPGGGLRYSFTGAPVNVREGFGRSVNLDGLSLQFDNLYGKGNFALFFGDSGGYGPEQSTSKLTLIFNTENGTITDKEGNIIITNDALKYDNLKEKRFSVSFEMNDNGSFGLKITVNGQALTGTLSRDIIALNNIANAFVVLTPYGTQTMDIDFLGVGMISQTKNVVDLIDAIGLIRLDSENALKAAQAAYDALSPGRQEQIINFDALNKAWTYWYSLDFDTMVYDAIDAIDAIGTVDILSGKTIREAEKIFDRLTDAQKAQVTNANVFTTALAKYNQLIQPFLALETSMYDPVITGLRFGGNNSDWEGKMSVNSPTTGGAQFVWTNAIRNIRDGSSLTYNMDGLRFQISNISKEAGKNGAQLSIQMGSTDNDYDSVFTGYCLALVLDTIEGELRAYPGGGLIIKSNALKHSAIENKSILFELSLTDEELYLVTLKIDGTQLRGIIPTSAMAYAAEDALKNTEEVKVALTPWANNGSGTSSFSATLLSIQSIGGYAFEELYEIIYAIDALPDKATEDNIYDILEVYEMYFKLSREVKERVTNYSKLDKLMNQIYEMGLVDYSDLENWVSEKDAVPKDDIPQVDTGDIQLILLVLAALSLVMLMLSAKRKSRARQLTGGNSHD